MAPLTRSTARYTTPSDLIEVREATTTKKTRFFEAYDSRSLYESLRAISKSRNIDKQTASRWLQQRTLLGSPVY